MAVDFTSRLAFLRAANQVETADVPPGTRSVSPNSRERHTILPATSMDAKWWVIHTEHSLREGTWRVRDTQLDNAPAGRDVHWSSGLVWLLGGIAHLASLFTVAPVLEEVQNAPLWTGAVLLALLAGTGALLVGRRFGWTYAGFLVLLWATSFPVYETFRVGEADHHGMALMFVLGSVLSLVAGGAGFCLALPRKASPALAAAPQVTAALPPAAAKPWFITAGLLGSAGLWVSAATTIPVLVACAIGAVAAFLAKPAAQDDSKKINPAPELWRTWAAWGAAGSLFFYLLEYFPGQLAWRLEVNHPLYALAWLAGGDLLARGLRKRAGGPFSTGHPSDRLFLASAVLAIAAPLAMILLRPDAFFWVADPFLLALHQEHIREFEPLFTAVLRQGQPADLFEYFIWPVFAIAGLLVLLFWAKAAGSWRPLLAFAFIVAALIQIEALLQIRWAGLAVALWSIPVLLVVILYGEGQFAVPIPRAVVAGFAAAAVFGLAAFPQLAFRTLLASGDVARHLPQSIVPSILLRDISHRLIQSSPQRLPLVLADPTSSTELAYYGGIPVVGTLYWENKPGLKRSAQIFSAPTEAQAREHLQAAGITHLVIPSWDSFSDVSAYTRLLQKEDSRPVSPDASYLGRVLEGKEHPAWLRPFAYPIPPAFGLAGQTVNIYQFLPDQPAFDAFLHWGAYHFEAGAFPAAERMFAQALREKPGDPRALQALALVKERMNQPPAK